MSLIDVLTAVSRGSQHHTQVLQKLVSAKLQAYAAEIEAKALKISLCPYLLWLTRPRSTWLRYQREPPHMSNLW